jgi:hypothetical protein
MRFLVVAAFGILFFFSTLTAATIYVGITTHASTTDAARKIAKKLHLGGAIGARAEPAVYHAERDCHLDRNFVVLILGQSNASNFAYTFTRSTDLEAAAFHDGKCFALADPVPGGDGLRGSQWPVFADLFKQRFGRSVTLISGAWGGSSMTDWSDKGYDKFAMRQVAELQKYGGKIAAVFWQQGEGDHFTDAGVYDTKFRVIVDRIRAAGIDAPIFVAQATRANGFLAEHIRAIQREIATRPGMAVGPDADLVLDRFDGTHLGAKGAADMALAWVDAIAKRHESNSDSSPLPK